MTQSTRISDTVEPCSAELTGVAFVADIRAVRDVNPVTLRDAGMLSSIRGGWRGRVFIGLVTHQLEQQATKRARELAESVLGSMPTVTIGLSAPVEHSGVASALWEARRAASYGMGTPALGPHLVRDFPVEEALAREPTLLRQIASTVRGIAEDPELILSLTVFQAHDGDRSAAAKALYVHTRTLDHRLRRIARVTGLRPRSLHDSRVLRTALVAHQLLTAEGEMSSQLPEQHHAEHQGRDDQLTRDDPSME